MSALAGICNHICGDNEQAGMGYLPHATQTKKTGRVLGVPGLLGLAVRQFNRQAGCMKLA